MQWAGASAGLVKEAGEQWRLRGQLSNDLLCCLHAVHGRVLQPALQLIDEKKVTVISAPCGRWVYRVSGSSGVPYVCLPGASYCQCPAYKYSVLLRKDAVVCKHVLAASLATAMGTAEAKAVTDTEMVDIIAGMD